MVLFNRGDGADTFLTSSSQSDIVSLGGGIRYANLSLSRTGVDLVLNLGFGDSITFKDWYAATTRRNVATLQVVTGATGGDYDAASSDRLRSTKVVAFNFVSLVNRFDQALAGNPALGSWPLAGQLDAAFVRGSSTQAIGGDMGYRHATLGGYADLGWQAVSTRLASTAPSTLQTLGASSTAVDPWTALQAGISLLGDATVGLPGPITPMASLSADELMLAALTAKTSRPSWLGQAQP